MPLVGAPSNELFWKFFFLFWNCSHTLFQCMFSRSGMLFLVGTRKNCSWVMGLDANEEFASKAGGQNCLFALVCWYTSDFRKGVTRKSSEMLCAWLKIQRMRKVKKLKEVVLGSQRVRGCWGGSKRKCWWDMYCLLEFVKIFNVICSWGWGGGNSGAWSVCALSAAVCL